MASFAFLEHPWDDIPSEFNRSRAVSWTFRWYDAHNTRGVKQNS